jgi:uncharacterized membrane protein YfcA
MVTILWISLILLAVLFSIYLTKDFIAHQHQLEESNWIKVGLIGFVVNFFDVLGIGAFAPQTALLKFTRQTRDKLIPGTMNVANTIPVLLQAIIFIRVIEVEPMTLTIMLITAALGAIAGARIISRFSENNIRLIMGFALLITVGFMIARLLGIIHGEGNAIGLTGGKLFIAASVNFLLGALMTAGIGLYAPCMALVFMLGMSPQVAFPIMMGSCAFLMPPASYKFIQTGSYNRKAAIGMAIPGSIAVLIAAFIVKSLPLDTLRIVVILVVVYTSFIMLRDGFKK